MNLENQRIIALVDMDCFYCQVEARLNPSLKGKPLAVVQYNQWKGGGIIAVNYEARDQGVTRGMRGDKAKEKCPDIELVSVPSVRGKADLTKYRDAGAEVAEVFCKFSDCVQRASVDEAYIDLTNAVHERINSGNTSVDVEQLHSTYVIGYCDIKNNNEELRSKGTKEWLENVKNETQASVEFQLLIGGVIVEELRAAVLRDTGFHCSAGVAHNKILAKLAAGLHKPRRQTILPHDSVPELYSCTSVSKVRNLGGKLGEEVMEKLNVKMMSDLLPFALKTLQQRFDEKTGSWLYNIARGIDSDPVTPRLAPKSIGCCKNFPGKNSLGTKHEVEKWLFELASEVSERLVKDFEDNKRNPKQLTVSFCQNNSYTRSCPLISYDPASLCNDAMLLLKKFNSASSASDQWSPPLTFLGLSVGKFQDLTTNGIQGFFKPTTSSSTSSSKTSTTQKTHFDSKQGNNRSLQHYFKQAEPDDPAPSEESSFFKRYLRKLKEKEELDEKQSAEDVEEEPKLVEEEVMEQSRIEEEENWISLSELCPDINNVDEDLIEMLPAKLANQLKELKGTCDEKREKCPECDEDILVKNLSEHRDYHEAIKLHQLLNKQTVPVQTSRNQSEETCSNKSEKCNNVPFGQNKRKRGRQSVVDKKARSITYFFKTVPRS